MTARVGITTVHLAGGTGAISASVKAQIEALRPTLTVERHSGSDRYGTSAAIAQEFFTDTPADPRSFTLASGQAWPDGVTGGAFAGALAGGAPMLLTKSSSLPSAISSFVAARMGPSKDGRMMGGPVVLSPAVQQQFEDLFQHGT